MSVREGDGFSGALAAALDAAGVLSEKEQQDGETASGPSPSEAKKPAGDKPEPAKTEAETSGQESQEEDDDGEVSMSRANLVVTRKGI